MTDFWSSGLAGGVLSSLTQGVAALNMDRLRIEQEGEAISAQPPAAPARPAAAEPGGKSEPPAAAPSGTPSRPSLHAQYMKELQDFAGGEAQESASHSTAPAQLSDESARPGDDRAASPPRPAHSVFDALAVGGAFLDRSGSALATAASRVATPIKAALSRPSALGAADAQWAASVGVGRASALGASLQQSAVPVPPSPAGGTNPDLLLQAVPPAPDSQPSASWSGWLTGQWGGVAPPSQPSEQLFSGSSLTGDAPAPGGMPSHSALLTLVWLLAPCLALLKQRLTAAWRTCTSQGGPCDCPAMQYCSCLVRSACVAAGWLCSAAASLAQCMWGCCCPESLKSRMAACHAACVAAAWRVSVAQAVGLVLAAAMVLVGFGVWSGESPTSPAQVVSAG